MAHTIFTKAKRNAERAIARGDIDEATRWTKIMHDHVAIARTIVDIAGRNTRPKPSPKLIMMTPAQRALAAQTRARTPTLPTMLDPDGFSPGGTPNWFLNQQRLERAGLPLHLAPRTKARRQ